MVYHVCLCGLIEDVGGGIRGDVDGLGGKEICFVVDTEECCVALVWEGRGEGKGRGVVTVPF